MEQTPPGPGKKARKPYTISRPRERWSPDEHERFLDAMLRFGRDWKKIEEHVRTKTTVQIRSHAQKYFLKVQKLGLPPHHPIRSLGMTQLQAPAGSGAVPSPMTVLHGQPHECPPGLLQSSIGWSCPGLLPASNDMQSSDWADSSGPSSWASHGGNPTDTPGAAHPGGSSSSSSMDWASTGTGSASEASVDETIPLPLSPDDMHFAQVYRFVGDVFDPATPCHIEAHLQRLKDMDAITVKTILLVLRNLEANLTAPQFEPIRRLLSRYDPGRPLSGQL
ncbi:protein REVEILLE 6 [Brachypodium distachyon]|uniref:protein REVEILLE 6 n=1 Tax=Brachypodium distachyon TaxID=15368 RepID=UPI000234E2F6|nr:protein REVEILLE 6 [Brachypodium distachyon]|eukprot:XP_003565211.1 protein REVEILLE 6 [Brachypodium distachyon]